MGNLASSLDMVIEELRRLRLELDSFQTRLAGLERDVSNLGVVSKRAHEASQENSNAILGISLLEEGRSAYRKPKRHTGSSYM